MKRALIAAFVALVALGMVAWAASPFYFEYSQDIAAGAPVGDWQAGLTFAFSDTTELDCPKEHPCGGYYQFSTISFCGDLFFGNSDAWVYPGAYYAGFEGKLRWNYLSFILDTRLDFDPLTNGWPWVSPSINAWLTDIELGLQFVSWASGWFGVNLEYDYTVVPGYFKLVPSFGFRLGDQSGCACW